MLLTLGLAGVALIPTILIGGVEAASMMGLGAGLGLATVLGGYFCLQYVFRLPQKFAVTFVVGGLVVRLALLVLLITIVVLTTDFEPSRFLLWVVAFYFALVVGEAWIFMRQTFATEEPTPR